MDKVREYLEAGKRLEGAATYGPWLDHNWDNMERPHVVAECLFVNGDHCHGQADIPKTREDATFVADARTRLPRYRRAIEEARIEADVIIHEDYDAGATDAAYRILDAMKSVLLGEESA